MPFKLGTFYLAGNRNFLLGSDTAPRSLLRFTFRKRAAACARASATALPWPHCSAFCQDVPREVNPIVHGREKTIRLIMRQALAAML